MLEGLEVSEVWLNEINKNNRIDSECYKKKNIHYNALINSFSYRTIGSFAIVTDGEHGSPELDETSGILYLSGHNIKDNILDFTDVRYCTEKIHIKNKRSALTKDSVLLSIVGTVGNASVVYQEIKANTDRNVATIKGIAQDINPYYLSTFLNSKFGKYQTLTLSTGNVQPLLNLLQVKSIKVCLPDTNFQNQIEQIVKSAHYKLHQCQKLYSEAETILLKSLGLIGWNPENRTINIKQLKESFLKSGRLDAEYYQSKFDTLFNVLSKFDCNAISEIAIMRKSIEPGSDAYCDEGVPFIRVSDITKQGISEPSIYLSRTDYNVEELHPKKDTILLSKDGSVGVAYKAEEDLDCITSGALLHLNVYNKNYLPDYLTLVLNSIVVQLQAERDANGAVIQHWKPAEIERVVIPCLSMKIQQTITSKVQQSFTLRKEAKQLLENAKKMIENEIEKN